MSEFIKRNKFLIIIILGTFVLYVISFFVVQNSLEEKITQQYAETLKAKVNDIDTELSTEAEYDDAIFDTLGHFYVGDAKIPVVAFFRGGSIGSTGAVFYSSLEECSESSYNKGQNEDGTDNRGIDGYLKVKDVYSCYTRMLNDDNCGVYSYINIDGIKNYVIYTYSERLHISVMAFVPKSCVESGLGLMIFTYVIVLVLVAFCFVIFALTLNANAKKYAIERDDAIKTMKEKDVRMDMLSYLMNEFTFEYDIKHDTMSFAEKYQQIFQRGKYFNRFLERLKTRYNIYHLDQQNIQDAFDSIMNGNYEGSCLFRLQMPNGNYEWFNSVYKVMVNNDGEPIYVVGKIMNVHQAQTEKEMLLTKSTRDPLTNLLNRSELEKRTMNFINEMEDDDMAAIVIMDLDHFKQVNDTFGHTKGDELLVDVAATIKDTFRTSDIVGRLGGDEFYIFMKDLMNEADAIAKCEKLRGILDKSVTYGDTSVKISTSMGIHFVRAGAVFLDIYMKADSALYRAKENGRNQYCVQREGDAINSSKG